MALLEEITPGVLVKGLLPGGAVTIISVKRHGSIGLELVYQDANGHLGSELLYSDSVAHLQIVPAGLPWGFDADGSLFRLVSEAYRIRLAYLFDRGDLRRCLIVAPGNLVEQWQDELSQRFSLVFDILTNDRLEASASGNAFGEMPLCIARLDKLSRDTDVQEKLRQSEWDVIVVDEAHKMSATFFSGEAKYTRRYRLGELLGKITRHLVLLTATPHNGKEEDFQLFMRLLDADRFEGKFRDGVHSVDVSDLMRHLVKEQLYTFESTPLFPERFAYTVNYQLSGLEDSLYHAVTGYVRQEFNRAEALDTGRKGTVGFALTTLQRRLASSPEAIYQSIKRRRERLERRLQEARQQQSARQGIDTSIDLLAGLPALTEDDLEDLDDAPGAEVEETEERVVDSASAALTIAELEIEIAQLLQLEALAQQVRRSGTDRKWESLASLLQNNAEMFDAQGQRRKLVIFTEHRDTLRYLAERIRTMLGCDEAVVTIHGGIGREERARAQGSFTQEKQVQVLLATDAAGEGINLQRAHLMVNYDLPWNPNRIEQRFGRIHRIGQQEVCHLWNLVASETREGEVFHTLLRKLEEERNALGGQVFNVLGEVFDQRPLRDLIVEAIRYGDRPDVRAKLTQVVDQALDRAHLQALLEERALTHEVMDVVRVRQVREEMERAAARRLQPHFIAAFFLEAFRRLGGKYYEREPQRYEITHVPAAIRNRIPRSHARAIILQRYERIVFEKERLTVEGKPQAALICPGHPLLDATLDLVLEQHRDLLTRGTILVNPTDMSEDLRVLFYLEHTIQDASTGSTGKRREVSRQLQFLEMDAQGCMRGAGYAPFLDYRPLREEEQALTPQLRAASWLQGDLEEQARSYAITELVPRHLAEVRKTREAQIDKTSAAVNDRLTREISYWDNRAAILKAQEAAGKTNARLNSQQARSRAEELYARLERRLNELEQERKLSPLPPVVVGGVLVVPRGLLNRLAGQSDLTDGDQFARETARVERIAMEAIMQRERRSETITVTRNEILTALNKPDDFILALVLVDGETTTIHYISRPFHAEPDFGATSVNYDLEKLLQKGAVI